jgi:RNA polymerase sigma factor (sigma-70 family)
MTELTDQELIAKFAGGKSEHAFALLVNRHLNLVYSTALRFVGNPSDAEEIVQAVFIILARKAGSLRRGKILSGWLYQTTRFTAANFVKSEIRRRHREQEAYMQTSLNEPENSAWQQIAPILDEAMGRLPEADRNALVLRYFENQTAHEIAAAMKLNEATAQKRISRALEKLRSIFYKRGVMLTGGLIGGAMSANSLQAAPARLSSAAISAGLGKAAISGSTALAIKATLLKLLWPKLQAGLAVGAGLSVIGGGVMLSQLRQAPATTGHQFTYRFRPTAKVSPAIVAGLSNINIRLLGTPGLAYEVVYSADGQSRSANGTLPGEVLFTANEFNATISVKGSGELGVDVMRGGFRMTGASVAPFSDDRVIAIYAEKGRTGISSRKLPVK